MNIDEYGVFFIEVGIINVVIVRVIAKNDDEFSFLNKIVTSVLANSKYEELKSCLVVDSINEDYNYTLTIIRDDKNKRYVVDLAKREKVEECRLRKTKNG